MTAPLIPIAFPPPHPSLTVGARLRRLAVRFQAAGGWASFDLLREWGESPYELLAQDWIAPDPQDGNRFIPAGAVREAMLWIRKV